MKLFGSIFQQKASITDRLDEERCLKQQEKAMIQEIDKIEI